MEGGSGPRGGVHNKQMFILSGFIISDPDCIYIYTHIYTIKTRLKYVYMCICVYVYMCICVYICRYVQNWLKKLEDPQGWFLACGDIFGLARTSSSLGKIFTHLTELWRNCHIFEGVKNHINAYISHPIRDRNMKT